MNLIKDFFHDCGDIIFGLVIVAIAVLVIGFQITGDFDIVAITQNSYEKIYEMVTGNTSTPEVEEILINPDDVSEADATAQNKNSNNETETSTKTEDISPLSEEEPATSSEDAPVVPEVPAIRNIVISPGSTADQVVSGLFANGIIGSKEEFLAEYARLPVGRFIRSGTFQIPTGSSSSEILAIIAP